MVLAKVIGKRATRHTWICPKTKRVGGTFKCYCESPCTDSKYGRVKHTYPDKNLRLYPGTLRGTDEWGKLYKIRVVVEKAINHIKSNMAIAGRKTRNIFIISIVFYVDLILKFSFAITYFYILNFSFH